MPNGKKTPDDRSSRRARAISHSPDLCTSGRSWVGILGKPLVRLDYFDTTAARKARSGFRSFQNCVKVFPG